MASVARKCPSCAGAIASPQATSCEWCGTPLAGAPVAAPKPPLAHPIGSVDGARLDQALRQLEALQPPRPSGLRGCAFFVLLAAAVLFVFLLLFMSSGEPTQAPSPSAADTPVEAPAAPPVERPSDR